MDILFGLTIGFGVGISVGMLLASFLTNRLHKETIEYYKKDSDKWFKSYIEMLGWYNQMTDMFFKEAIKNITK